MNALRKKALYFLSIREYSKHELLNKLNKYASDGDDVEQLINNLVADGYLSEERFVENYVNSKSKKFGVMKIKYGLREKGINCETIDEYLSGIDRNAEIEVAYRILVKKINNNFDDKTIAKGIRFLQVRGFDYLTIKSALQKLKNSDCT